jgi:hypothetical protein
LIGPVDRQGGLTAQDTGTLPASSVSKTMDEVFIVLRRCRRARLQGLIATAIVVM